MDDRIEMPIVFKGRRSKEKEAIYQQSMNKFAQDIIDLVKRIGMKVQVRGLCYIMEEHGLSKGDFDKFSKYITALRKDGRLPLDIVTADEARGVIENFTTDHDWRNPEQYAEYCLDNAKRSIRSAYWYSRPDDSYEHIPWHEGLEHCCFMVVEKADLVTLFRRRCFEYRIPIANFRGWSDLHLLASIAKHFKEGEAKGLKPVLLYCGDHDIAGLKISRWVPVHFFNMHGATGWAPYNLIVDRFGLNEDFIEEQGLTWIDGLETSSGKDLGDESHSWHDHQDVQDYIAKHGERKVEANALVVRPQAADRLVLDAITRYVPKDWPRVHAERTDVFAQEAKDRYASMIPKDDEYDDFERYT